MQMKAAVLVVTAVSAAGLATNPIAKVLQMIDDLTGKVIAEGETQHKVYAELAKFCEDRHDQIDPEIHSGAADADGLRAAIVEAVSEIDGASSQIEELVASIAEDEKDLKEAAGIRAKENEDFVAVEKDLAETIDMLERSLAVIERATSGGGSFAQIKGANGVIQALQSMVSAEQMSVADSDKLSALVQTANDQRDNDAAFGAPAAAVYKNSASMTGGVYESNGGIVDTLQGLLDSSNEQLDSSRQAERQSKQNYDMKKQSLDDEVKYASNDLDDVKKNAAANQEAKATAEGDLTVTIKSLNEDKADLAVVHHDCMTKAQAYEVEVTSRAGELKALAVAKKIIVKVTSLVQTDSFMQLVSTSNGNTFVHMLRSLASDYASQSLSQLASRVQSTIRISSSSGEDPLIKIKEMTNDMIAKLEDEQAEDATQKVFCDKELKESTAKKADKTAEVDKLSTRKGQKEAQSIKRKEEVATLQKELSELASTHLQMDTLRREEKAACDTASPDLKEAIRGVQLAIKALKDYYSNADNSSPTSTHDVSGSDGASNGIISLLEIAEADFSKNLSEILAEEEVAAAAYKAATQEHDLDKLAKEAGVKYKTKEAASLDKAVSDLATDLGGVQDELDAVNSALSSLNSQCIGKAESYVERKERREAEITRLQDSLETLEGEADETGETGETSEAVAGEAAAGEAAAVEAPAGEAAAVVAPAGEAPAGEAAAVVAPAGEAALVQVSAKHLRDVRKHVRQ